MSDVVVAPMLVAFATAILTMVARADDRLQRGVSLAGGAGYLVATVMLFERVVVRPSDPVIVPYYLSDWPAPYGITLVADALSAFMLLLAGIVSVVALVYATAYVGPFGQRLSFHPLFHFTLVGVSGAFLTGDLFNLFVWFEVMLMATYILVVFYSGPEHTRAALTYVVLNLVGSAVMLLAIGGLYASTGTLNMADMARRLAEPAAFDVAIEPTLGLGALLLSVFVLKAGLVPFHFWVPAAYRAAPAPVTALLAGVVKKVGVYAVIRVYFTVFAAGSYATGSALDYVGTVLFVLGAASILFGGVAAAGQNELNGLLAYSSIAQVGFIVLPIAVGAVRPEVAELGIAAALVYSFNHGLAKALLFLASGVVGSTIGTTRFDRLGGLAERAPILASAFLVGGLSLVGIPPLLGFFGKLYVFQVSVEAYAAGDVISGTALTILLGGAVLTIAYVTRAWNAVFWGEPSELVETRLPDRWPRTGPEGFGLAGTETVDESPTATDGGRADPRSVGALSDPAIGGLLLRTVAVVTLAVTLVVFGVGVEFMAETTGEAARAAVDTEGYVRAVLSGGGE